MNLLDVLKVAGKRRARKRRGRGEGSGLGKSAGRGQKGAKARSGWRRRYGYEGGQMPLSRRVPKRGFSNVNFARYFDVVNVGDLENRFADGAQVDLKALTDQGILKPRFELLKVLGEGTLTRKLTVVAHAASAGARKKIEAAGGSLQCLLPPRKIRKPPPRPAKAPAAAKEAEEKSAEGAQKPRKEKKAEGGAPADAKREAARQKPEKGAAPPKGGEGKPEKKGGKGGEAKKP